MKNVFKALSAAVLAVCLGLTACAAPEENGRQDERRPQETVQTQKVIRIYTDPAYKGQANAALKELADKINGHVAAHPDTFSGSYFSSDSTKLLVGVARPGDKAATDLEKLVDQLDPRHQSVVMTAARWSWTELEAVKDRLVAEYLKTRKGGLQSVGLDTSRNAVVVHVLRKPDGPRLEENPIVIEIANHYGDVVMFGEAPGSISTDTAK